MVDTSIDTPCPKSMSHIPYRYSYRHLINVRSRVSISHIDLPYRYRIICFHSECKALAGGHASPPAERGGAESCVRSAGEHDRRQRGGVLQVQVGDFHILGPGIRPNPSESDPRPNPSESGIQFCRVEMPIQTVKFRKRIPPGLLGIRPNSPESDPLLTPSESGCAIPGASRDQLKPVLDGVPGSSCSSYKRKNELLHLGFAFEFN
jgi:hypothetical protein